MNALETEIRVRAKVRSAEYEPTIEDLSGRERLALVEALSQDVGLVRPKGGQRMSQEADALLKVWARGEPKFCGREIRSACGVKSGTPLGRMVKRTIGSVSPDYLVELEKYEQVKSAYNSMPLLYRKFAELHYKIRPKSEMNITDFIYSVGMYRDSYYK